MPIAATRWNLFKSVVAIMFNKEKNNEMIVFDATDMKVASKLKILKVALDGEVVRLKPPLNYRTRPKALRVIVPQDLSQKS